MGSFKNILLLSCVVFWAASCAAPSPARWEYEEKAINLSFEADKKLNVRDGKAHTLSVCVYQLKDPNAFRQLAEDADGLYKLLGCSSFDSSVVNARRVIVNPGKSLKVSLDRADGAKFVGIVAGYYNIDRDKIVRLYKIPQEKRGLISRRMVPMPLNAVIKLGPKQIVSSQEA
ncbi:MAG TPA: type VI secretion system lipoprotein TssJ [Deltaproteobacteria bacterium]|jgi:type VI secretion system VasD/TssJ family lipoprotein|nr:type VI secretion system lipoprotein TssJ [Deltaproteobacteria bacterium]HQI00652.1 type VI secretion system lipoprotein TssJ [Deltaproteobacteria bacterium]HQJ09685.1 type VI secretion system lipoprotein TssJ [Deltaproteobacteria bacterium]